MDSKTFFELVKQTRGKIALEKELLADMETGLYGVSSPKWEEWRHGNKHQDISDLLIRLEDRRQKILVNMASLLSMQEVAEKLIARVENENAREILYYRYILGYKWETVAERVHINLRWAQRLADKACTTLDALTEEPQGLPTDLDLKGEAGPGSDGMP